MSTAEMIARALLGLLSFTALIAYLRWHGPHEDQTPAITEGATPELDKDKATTQYFPPEHTAATKEQIDWLRGPDSSASVPEVQQAALLRELTESWRTAQQKRGERIQRKPGRPPRKGGDQPVAVNNL